MQPVHIVPHPVCESNKEKSSERVIHLQKLLGNKLQLHLTIRLLLYYIKKKKTATYQQLYSSKSVNKY